MKKTFVLLLTMILLAACGNHSRRAEIEARKAALKEKQTTELRQAQQDLALVDSLLAIAKAEHEQLHQWVMDHATQLNNQSPEVLRLNQLRAHRDSLQVQWETLGARIKYIRRVSKQ